jgi:hypothetical protein
MTMHLFLYLYLHLYSALYLGDNAIYGRLTARVLLLWVCLYCFLTTVLYL